MTFVLPIFLKS